MTRFILLLGFALAALLVLPLTALATGGVPSPNGELILPGDQLWSALIGAIVPAFMYVVNYHAPWFSEQAKGVATLLVTAAVAALFTLLDSGDLALDAQTLQVVGTAVVMAFAAHVGFYRPSGISAALGGGRNSADTE